MPAVFVPARNSRHRTACFALYKALIRQSVRVPLPDSLVRPPGLTGPVHPIKHLVRKGFRRNKTDTSPRLVISALRNGYKFLDMLTAAQSPSTPEYNQIHDLIRARQAKKSAALSLRSLRSPPPPPPSSAPNPNTIPLLTRVSGPDEAPRYKPTARPRPLSELGGSGIRRVPVLELAAGLPYLRQTKPQTLVMNRVIKQKSEKIQEKVAKAMDCVAAEQEAARWEDMWETIVDGQLRPDRPDQPGLFRRFQQLNMDVVFQRLNAMRADGYARGSALEKLVREERALRDAERTERRERRRREREARKAGGTLDGASQAGSGGEAGEIEAGDDRAGGSSVETAMRLAAESAKADPFVDPERPPAAPAGKTRRVADEKPVGNKEP